VRARSSISRPPATVTQRDVAAELDHALVLVGIERFEVSREAHALAVVAEDRTRVADIGCEEAAAPAFVVEHEEDEDGDGAADCVSRGCRRRRPTSSSR